MQSWNRWFRFKFHPKVLNSCSVCTTTTTTFFYFYSFVFLSRHVNHDSSSRTFFLPIFPRFKWKINVNRWNNEKQINLPWSWKMNKNVSCFFQFTSSEVIKINRFICSSNYDCCTPFVSSVGGISVWLVIKFHRLKGTSIGCHVTDKLFSSSSL